MKKIFLKSYEDNTLIGGTFNITSEDHETLCSIDSWDAAMEILKKSIDGEFKIYENYTVLLEEEGKFDTLITGLS